jgi:hypothetical protein
VRFDNQPFEKAVTYATLGLSHHVLKQGWSYFWDVTNDSYRGTPGASSRLWRRTSFRSMRRSVRGRSSVLLRQSSRARHAMDSCAPVPVTIQMRWGHSMTPIPRRSSPC